MILNSVFYRSFQVDRQEYVGCIVINFVTLKIPFTRIRMKIAWFENKENFLTRWIFYLHRQKERGRKNGMSSKKEIEDALNHCQIKI